MERDTIYFFSDAHIGARFPDAKEWENKCITFLRSLADRAAALYVLGDLFDFWIEYRNAIRPDYFRIIHELRNLVDRGVPVHYFAGNHDFAFGPFITETLGIAVHPGHMETTLQGRRVHLFHGDGLLKNDIGYRALKRILRNRVNQSLYRLLPPWVGIRLASVFSGASRGRSERLMNEKVVDEYRRHARSYLDNGNDVVFFGHSHRAELSRWGDKYYCNTGSWMRAYNFATMTGGVVKLWRYRDGDAPEELPAVDRK